MTVSAIKCVSCGAPVDRAEGQKTLTCSYCGCELHYTTRSSINLDELPARTNPVDISTDVFLLNQAIDGEDFQAIYNCAVQIIQKDPTLWLGYYYAAYGLFWFTSGNVRNSRSYFESLNEIITNIDSARQFADDLIPIIQLEEDLIFNLCAIGNRQGRSDFVGSNIIQSFEIFSYAKRLDSNSKYLFQIITNYADRLTRWAISQLEEDSRDSLFTPNASYLEYIYYCWKHFDVLIGVEAFEKYSRLFVKKSSNKHLVDHIQQLRNEMIPSEPRVAMESKGFFGLFK
jgi:DNA-directed RNA polymerase subunit RPC12/RpoP